MSTPYGEPTWLTHARKDVGLREIKGPEHSPRILALCRAAQLAWIRDDETAWCATFACGILEEQGVVSPRNAAARSFCLWGVDVMQKTPGMLPLGAVVVYSRPPNPSQGHVGFAVGVDQQGRILTLGGNQGDAVSIAPFDPGRLIAARWPAAMLPPDPRVMPRIPFLNSNAAMSARES